MMDQQVLLELAQNPKTLQYSWESTIRPAITKYLVDLGFDDLIQYLENYNNCPFTIQRLSEILLTPHPYISAKYKRALEKCLKVSTTLNQEDMMQL